MTALRFLAALSLLCLASTAQAAWPHGGHYAPVGAGYYSAGYSGYPLAVTGWQTTGVVPYYGANLVTVDGLGVTTVGVPTVGVASWGVPGYVWGYAPNHNASLGETLLILKQLNLLGGKDNSNEIADINGRLDKLQQRVDALQTAVDELKKQDDSVVRPTAAVKAVAPADLQRLRDDINRVKARLGIE